jgi:tetraacyldisaccharide-1-P 4'-kinase
MDGPLRQADEARVAALAPRAARFEARRVPRSLRPLAGGAPEPPEALRGRALGMLSGIARPASFRGMLESLGARVVAERTFPDHHAFRARDLEGLRAAAPLWVATEKDAVKIEPAWTAGADVRVLEIGIEGAAGLPSLVAGRLASPRGRVNET